MKSSIKRLLIIQILLYVITMSILYASRNSKLDSSIPFLFITIGGFMLSALGSIAIMVWSIAKNGLRETFDVKILALIGAVILLAILYLPILSIINDTSIHNV